MAKKDKIPVTTENQPELNNPFASLQIDNLPLGDAQPPTPATTRVRAAKSLGRVVLRRETAHRGGKVVIVIHDFAPAISAHTIEELARKLKTACGCGGTTRQRTIEMQGNQVDKIRGFLETEGFRVAGVK